MATQFLLLGSPIRGRLLHGDAEKAGGGGRLVADRWAHEFEILVFKRSSSPGTRRGDVSTPYVSRHVLLISKGLLQLALSDWNHLRIPVACRTGTLSAQFSSATVARLTSARLEVCPPGLFCVGDLIHVGSGNSRIHGESLWVDRRRKDAQFLSSYRADWVNHSGAIRPGVGVYPKFMVSLSLPLWGFVGFDLLVESHADPTESRAVHRLRQVREGLSRCAARRW